MLIRGDHVFLKPFEQEHLYDPAYYGWLCDHEVVRYIGRDELLQFYPFEEVENYVKQLWASEYCNFFAVHEAQTDKFIGTAKVNFLSEKGRQNGIADIGIMLGDRSFWGRGLASDTLRTISIFAFDNLRARKLTAGGNSANVPVIKAFLRIGYRVEGTLREHNSLEDGYNDHILMGCFEYELARSSLENSF